MAQTTYQERKAQAADDNRCARIGCASAPADDSAFCLPHRDADRAYKRHWWRKTARKRKRLRLCRHCGKPRRKRDTSCAGCRARRDRLTAVQTTTANAGLENQLEKSERIAARTRKHEDGRTRYHGQNRRGQQPAAQLNAQDIGFARASISAGEKGLAMLETEEVKALPRIQREDVRQAAAHHLARASDHLDDVLERLGHFKARHGSRGGE